MSELKSFLIDWFQENGEAPEEVSDSDLSENYFDLDWIDSIGVIGLIADLEEEFDFVFTEEHFQDRRFPTLTGLCEIIEEIKKG